MKSTEICSVNTNKQEQTRPHILVQQTTLYPNPTAKIGARARRTTEAASTNSTWRENVLGEEAREQSQAPNPKDHTGESRYKIPEWLTLDIFSYWNDKIK